MNHSRELPLHTINTLHQALFIALALLMPLYLSEKGLKVEEIGLVLALLPAVMFVMRTAFSAVADVIGNRKIFIIEGIGMTLATSIYLAANTPLLFAIGKISEGIGHSAYWAVIRSELYRTSKNREQTAAYTGGLRDIGGFIGRVGAGALALYLGFTSAFLALTLVGVVILFAAFRIKNHVRKEKLDLQKIWGIFTEKRSRAFWHVACIISITAPLYAGAAFFLYPLYLSTIGLNTFQVGALLAISLFISGATALFVTRKNIQTRTIGAGIVLLMAVPFFFIAEFKMHTIALILLVAVGEGCASTLFERMIAVITKKRKNVSTDIALLHIPYRFAEFASLALLGFIVSAFGFGAAFAIIGIAMAAYAVLVTGFFDKKGKN